MDVHTYYSGVDYVVVIGGCALSVMLPTLAGVLSTPHDYSSTFQGGYSARFTASRRVLTFKARRIL